MIAYTDYPIIELGDIEKLNAPIRECIVRSYDGNKYCLIRVEGVEKEVKAGYLYIRPGRYGEVPGIDVGKLEINREIIEY